MAFHLDFIWQQKKTCLDQAFSKQTSLSISHPLPLALVLLVSTSVTDVLITTLSSLPDHQRGIRSMKKAASSSRKSQREILLLSDSTLGEVTNPFQLLTSRNLLVKIHMTPLVCTKKYLKVWNVLISLILLRIVLNQATVPPKTKMAIICSPSWHSKLVCC